MPIRRRSLRLVYRRARPVVGPRPWLRPMRYVLASRRDRPDVVGPRVSAACSAAARSLTSSLTSWQAADLAPVNKRRSQHATHSHASGRAGLEDRPVTCGQIARYIAPARLLLRRAGALEASRRARPCYLEVVWSSPSEHVRPVRRAAHYVPPPGPVNAAAAADLFVLLSRAAAGGNPSASRAGGRHANTSHRLVGRKSRSVAGSGQERETRARRGRNDGRAAARAVRACWGAREARAARHGARVGARGHAGGAG